MTNIVFAEVFVLPYVLRQPSKLYLLIGEMQHTVCIQSSPSAAQTIMRMYVQRFLFTKKKKKEGKCESTAGIE